MEKKVKVLCIGDLHFRRDAIPEGRALCEAILQNITSDLSLAVVMGDTLDRFGDVKTAPLTLAIDFLHRLSQKVRTVLIIGNHDLPHKCCNPRNNHPFTALQYWGERMTVADHPVILEVEGLFFTFAPYYEPGFLIPELELTLPSTEARGWKETSAVFGHQELHCISFGYYKGGSMAGSVRDEGELGAETKSTKNEKNSGKNDDACEDVWESEYPLAVMGHIHDHCRPLNNVLYVGASSQRSYSESADKTLSLLTFTLIQRNSSESGTSSHIKPSWSEERINLGLPSLQQATIDAKDLQNYQPPHNCKLKLTIRGTSVELDILRQQQTISKLKEQGIKIAFSTVQSFTSREDFTPRRKTLQYGQMLALKLSTEPELYPIFTSIFSGLILPPTQDIRTPEVREKGNEPTGIQQVE